MRLAALGAAPGPSDEAPGTARDEFWPLLAALTLLFLIIEWLVYERDGARRIVRSLTSVRLRASRGKAA